jgi:chromosome partitioning protein
VIVTVGHTKGGSGKTTLALHLAIGRALAGREVWLIDGDRQGTAQCALAIRAESGRTPLIACAQYADGPTLRHQVQHQARKFDDIIIDAGGRDSSALRAALMLSDVLLVPFQPRSFDVWALQDVLTLVEEAHSIRDNLRACAVLNLADPKGADNAEAATVASALTNVELLPMQIGRRKAYANASGAGLSVLECSPKDPKACAEIARLLDLVFIGKSS